MPKSIHSDPYGILLALLRAMRTRRGVRQEDLVSLLRMNQSTISRIERGERRLDVMELRAFCQAIGWTLRECIDAWEQALRDGETRAHQKVSAAHRKRT